MRRIAGLLTLATALGVAPIAPAEGSGPPSTSHRFQPLTSQFRTEPGDLCTTALSLGRGESLITDLCAAWNDHDPGAADCSPCALPGPDVVAVLDTQAGEVVQVDASVLEGSADVRLYLATACEDPASSCLVGSSGPSEGIRHTMVGSGEVYLFVDTTGECATVQVSRPEPASSPATTLTTLKAIYR